MILGERIKERRKALNLTQAMLTEISGVPQGYISRYESGDSEPLASNVIALAKALQVSADWLLGISDELPIIPQTELDLNAQEKEVLALFRATPKNKKSKIVDIIRLTQ
jgi:HTH-type transcriptional regulator, cell division transcriptional repressor